MKIAIIDYGAGNLPSVERALHGLGGETERATQPAQVAAARAIILPGVGHFGAFVAGLRERSLDEPLLAAHARRIPILGICLGLQAMFASSEEAPQERGFGFFDEKVTAMPTNVKSPHIGWNQLRPTRESRLLRGVPNDAFFYFAHSFAAPASAAATVAACDHGVSFAAVIERENLYGVQFHPEKSGEAGELVLRNFLETLS
ncbi:MAG: imidazole glycerol phosphate synthase subunit HisH [Candidatus Acidiferrales bacterium]